MFAPKNEVGKNTIIYMRLGWAIESEQYWIICFVERDWASGYKKFIRQPKILNSNSWANYNLCVFLIRYQTDPQ